MPRIHANGVDLHYHVQGKGTPIVFLHPACIGSRVFTYLRNDLARGHQTLLFDFRGHGRSEASKSRITIPLLVEDTCRLMDALEISSAFLCSYSASSVVVLEALLRYSDRFRGAVLMGGMAKVSDWKTKTKLRMGVFAARLRAKELLALPQLWSNSDSMQTYRSLRSETLAGNVANWREFMDSIRRYSALGRLPEIRQPVLLLCAEGDKEANKHARTLQQGLPNVTTIMVPGRKHALPTHDPEKIGPIIREWLYVQEEQEQEEKGEYSVQDRTNGIPDMESPVSEQSGTVHL